jgi:hypothetical protein
LDGAWLHPKCLPGKYFSRILLSPTKEAQYIEAMNRSCNPLQDVLYNGQSSSMPPSRPPILFVQDLIASWEPYACDELLACVWHPTSQFFLMKGNYKFLHQVLLTKKTHLRRNPSAALQWPWWAGESSFQKNYQVQKVIRFCWWWIKLSWLPLYAQLDVPMDLKEVVKEATYT